MTYRCSICGGRQQNLMRIKYLKLLANGCDWCADKTVLYYIYIVEVGIEHIIDELRWTYDDTIDTILEHTATMGR